MLIKGWEEKAKAAGLNADQIAAVCFLEVAARIDDRARPGFTTVGSINGERYVTLPNTEFIEAKQFRDEHAQPTIYDNSRPYSAGRVA